MKAYKKAEVIRGRVVSRAVPQNGKTALVLDVDGKRVHVLHQGREMLNTGLVSDIFHNDILEMYQGDIFTLKVLGSFPARYSVDGSGEWSIMELDIENSLGIPALNAIAALEVGQSIENMHDATIRRVK